MNSKIASSFSRMNRLACAGDKIVGHSDYSLAVLFVGRCQLGRKPQRLNSADFQLRWNQEPLERGSSPRSAARMARAASLPISSEPLLTVVSDGDQLSEPSTSS